MNYKIKNDKGIVTFKMRTGKDLVRSNMGLAYAQSIVARAKDIKEENGEIIVDDLYFFPVETTKKKKTEEDAE